MKSKINIKPTSLFLLLTLFFSCNLSWAANNESIFANDEDHQWPKVFELNWLNQTFLDKQRKAANDIARENFGAQFHGTKSDLKLVQRIIDNKLIKPHEKKTLQSLGVILGDIYSAEYKSLSWKVYEDDFGKSHAVCVDKTKECIFPITMLSRRIELGFKPDANKVYNKGLDLIYDLLPKLPFTRKPY